MVLGFVPRKRGEVAAGRVSDAVGTQSYRVTAVDSFQEPGLCELSAQGGDLETPRNYAPCQ